VAAAGAVWSSAADLSRWLRMLLAEGKWEGRPVLADETVAELLAPQALIPRGAFAYPTVQLTRPHWTTYGFGWFQQDYLGLMVHYHTGSIDGMSAIVAVVPELELGLAVLANGDHAELRHALLWRTVDAFAARAPPRDWSAELRELYGKEQTEQERVRREQESQRVPGTIPSLDLARYAGTYENPLLGELGVRHEDGRLRLRLGPRLTGTLEHWHYDTFRVQWDRAWQGDELAVFQLDLAGVPSRLVVMGTEWMRRAEPATE
jgi:CubicO group peptidase (beta-lactamase class C family)